MTTFNVTDEQIAAAQLRIVLDQKMGRDTPEIIRRIAAMSSVHGSDDKITKPSAPPDGAPPASVQVVVSDPPELTPRESRFQMRVSLAAEIDRIEDELIEATTFFAEPVEQLGHVPKPPEVATMASALTILGGVDAELGRHEEAIAALRRAASIAESAGDRVRAGNALAQLGALGAGLGRYDEAIAALQRLVSITESTESTDDDRIMAASAFTTLGTIYAEIGRHDEAVAALQRAVSIAEESIGH